eukprot:jgi/Chlat1/7278/Chrsp58S06910
MAATAAAAACCSCSSSATSIVERRRSFLSGAALPQAQKHAQCHQSRRPSFIVRAAKGKVDFGEWLGGRGLGTGEKSFKTDEGVKELFEEEARLLEAIEKVRVEGDTDIAKDDFGVGGLLGGELGLQEFNKLSLVELAEKKLAQKRQQLLNKNPVTLPTPILMPGMTAIVTNPTNAYYNYTGIVQRVTDAAVGVLFEGGNWDKLVTFRLDEVKRSEKGAPMVNPKSAILEDVIASLPAEASASPSSS